MMTTLESAIETGNLDMVRLFPDSDFSVKAMNNAAKHGHLNLVQWLHENRREGCTDWAVVIAAQNGHLEVVQWLYANMRGWSKGCTNRAMNCAAANGQLHMVKWLHENTSSLAVLSLAPGQRRTEGCTTRAMDCAAEHGHLHVVQWLHENTRDEGCTTEAMDYAAAYGHLEVVQWLHENRKEGCTIRAMNWASLHGHLEVVQWLHENCDALSLTPCQQSEAINNAAKNGHLEVLKWLCENRSEGGTADAMYWAARSGQLEVVKWLHENRTEGCTTEAMDWAAWNGHFEVVKWLNENTSGKAALSLALGQRRDEGCSTVAIINSNDEITWFLVFRYKHLKAARKTNHIVNSLYSSIEMVEKAWSRYKLRRALKTAVSKYRLKLELEFMPNVGVQYESAASQFEKLLDNRKKVE